MDASVPERLSWRDPDGFVVRFEGRILRAVAVDKAEQVRLLLREPWIGRLIADGLLPRTIELADPPPGYAAVSQWMWLEHDTVDFPCYPHEITALQLYDSAQLTLRIASEAANNGWILKDASCWNVLHSQGKPVFVDFLSFERLTAGQRSWISYGQFVRHFLLPLMLYRHLGITPGDIFLVNRDGMTPERAYQLLNWRRLLSATSLELIVLPKWLSRAGGKLIEAHATRESPASEGAGRPDMVVSTLHRLRRMLEKLSPNDSPVRSVWKSYEEERNHYAQADLEAKTEFVRSHVPGSRTVLDLGCNAGEFSILAASSADSVVAADSDHPALSRLYARIRHTTKRVTPIVLNIGRPTPAVGWQNSEVASFVERACGRFDCILALGLVHHLLVGERATLPMIVDLLHRLEPKRVIIEWIDPTDQKFRQIAGLNIGLYRGLNPVVFEACVRTKFVLAERFPLPCGTRVMYLLTR